MAPVVSILTIILGIWLINSAIATYLKTKKNHRKRNSCYGNCKRYNPGGG